MKRAPAIFLKAARQQRRDLVGLALTLLTTPFFVFFYWVVFSNHDPSVEIALLAPQERATEITRALESATSTDDELQLEVKSAASLDAAISDARSGHVELIIHIEHDTQHHDITTHYDTNNHRAVVAAGIATRALLSALSTPRPGAPRVVTSPLGETRTAFERYVPNLLIFAIIMLVFSTSMAVAKEIEQRTIERLIMTNLSSSEYLAGTSAFQFILGLGSFGVTLATAIFLGYEPGGSLALTATIMSLTILSCVGLGVVIASISKSVARAFLTGSVVMFLLMLFSGIVFPLPSWEPITIGSRAWGPFDLLPTVHAVRALGRTLDMSASAHDVLPELLALAALSIASFTAGAIIFRRTQRWA